MPMRKILLILTFLITLPAVFAQEFGNEWISYNQQYYAFKVWQNGVYRIYQQDLVNAGIPIQSVPVTRFQIFGKQQELPIYVQDDGNGFLDPGEYIEFYAERNTGWLDSLLYLNPITASNPSFSLYNDTLRYFFSWSTNTFGKRFVNETDVNHTNWPSANFVVATAENTPNNAYLDGRKEAGSSSSFFVEGEGWGASAFNGVTTGPQNYNLSIPGYYTGGDAPLPILHTKVTSNSNAAASGPFNHHLRLSFNGNVVQDTLYSGYRQIRLTRTVPMSWLTSPTAQITMQIVNDLGALTDFQAFTYGRLIYPRNLNFSSGFARFQVVNGASAKQHLAMSNVSGTERVLYVWGDTPRRIPVTGTNPCYAVVPNSTNGQPQEAVLINTAQIGTINQFEAVNGTGFFTNFLSTNFENAVLMVYPKSLQGSAQQYAAFRQSLLGGTHNVVLVDAEELYWQFGGGIEKHIMGIRRFAHLAYLGSVQKPKALFLIGKGVREANEGPGSLAGSRKSISSFQMNLIPSFGYPSSDICITAGLENTQWEPLIPTGRIAAKNNDEVLIYLSKVQEQTLEQDPFSIYDTPRKDWQKHILHFGGGSTPGEINTIRSYLNNMAARPEGADFGGKVHTYIKENSEPFNPAILSQVADRIEEGVSVMTFFAHAAANGFEINIDEPQNWNNKGRYPLVIGNACYTGDIFLPLPSSASEKFVIQPELGAIAFLSTVKLGFAAYLYNYSNEFYRQFSLTNYNQPLGLQIKETVRQVQTTLNNFIMETTCTQMTLHGDPLVKVNAHQKPEIEITEQSVYFTPENLNLSTEEFQLNLVVKNLGRSILQNVNVVVVRKFPGQSADSIYVQTIPQLHYMDTLVFNMPLQPNVGVGMNQFDITVDIPSQIEEQYDEFNNNRLLRSFFINVDGIIPVKPYDFAVVPGDSVSVKASTVNPFADFNTYRFELDTTDLFNSPQKRFALVSGLGGVKEVHPGEWRSASSGMPFPLVCQDSMVYFWRVSIDGSDDWREHSFQYIPGKEGWGQDHFFQFKKNNFTFIDYDRPNRRRNFNPIEKVMRCDVWDAGNNDQMWFETAWYVDNTLQDYTGCLVTPSLHVAVVDPSTMEAWRTRGINSFTGQIENADKNFGNANDLDFSPPCRVSPDAYFIFRQTTAEQLQSFENMVMNEIPDSAYFLIYTFNVARYDLWNSLYPQTYNVFQALGSDSIFEGRENRAFILMGKKGRPDLTTEVVAQNFQEFITLSAPMTGKDYAGRETSTTIGPSASWETVYWKQDNPDPGPGDTTVLRITALDIFGSPQVTIDTAFTANDSIINFNNLVNASQYPYLRLAALYEDKEYNTPAQVDRWHVLYDQLPEAAIDGTNGYYWSAASDTIPEGKSVSFAVDVRNIGERHMDSLLVKYWIEDKNQVRTYLPYPRQDSLRIGQVIRDTLTFQTNGLSGLNSLWIEVNPYIPGSTVIKDQPEQFHFNNVAQIPFFVGRDNINPILDVTFDGVHILNGDIVSPRSEIVITLKDENPLLIMNSDADTSLFAIYLKDPTGVQKRIFFINGDGHQVMQWVPAADQHNKFKIIFPAEFKMDGKYQLLVQGQDLSGNLSGDMEYRIEFEVIRESSITYLMNYPNPFSTSTRFVFTLTGDRVPDHMIIQIMTVTGRVVREITLAELGPIRIGRNVTEYAWDGRDEFGDPLANGVYLYRVLTNLDGDRIKHRESGADEFFKKEFGKMYLLR